MLPGSRPLGNLTLYRGMMLSLNAYGLTAFEQRDAIERQIAQRQTTDPHDEWASVKRAEIALLHNDPTGAIHSLDRVDSQHLAGALGSLLSQRALRGADRRDSSRLRHERPVPRAALGPGAQTGDERLLVGRLEAERDLAVGKYGDAFAALQKLAITDRRGVMIPARTIRMSPLTSTLGSPDACSRSGRSCRPPNGLASTSCLPARPSHVLHLDRPMQERFAELYAFHPAAQSVIMGLVEQFAAEKDFFRAERLLLRQERIADDAAAATAQLRLAQLLDERGLIDDAATAYRRLAAWYPGAQIFGGQTAASYVQSRWDAGLLDPHSYSGPDWGDVDLKVHRFGTNYLSNHIEELLLGGGNEPYFDEHRFSIDERRQRLEIVRSTDDGDRWMLPLRLDQPFAAGGIHGRRCGGARAGRAAPGRRALPLAARPQRDLDALGRSPRRGGQ